MKLTTEETAQAARMGWVLCDVYDAGTKRCSLTILPVDFTKTPSADVVLRRVTEMAKARDALAIKALTLVAKSKLYKRKP